jgi:hypothetical protein
MCEMRSNNNAWRRADSKWRFSPKGADGESDGRMVAARLSLLLSHQCGDIPGS